MKLELKHLAPYLPYEFKFISEMDKPYDEFGEVRVWTADGIIKLFGNFCLITSENNDAYDINFSKPILFPLSSLTKEITINGKNFMPIKNLFELHHCGMRIKERLQCFSFNKNKIKYDDFNCAITDGVNMFGYSNYGGFKAIDIDEYRDYTVINQLELLMKLFEWKFDVFGLIEAGLAEPVTEEFNPYK